MIVAAAIRDSGTGTVYTMPKPARHSDIATHINVNQLGEAWKEDVFIRGFVDENGNFYNRKEAMYHCEEFGPDLDYGKINTNLGLYSEDLW